MRAPFHPALFALHPVVALYASNVSLVPLAEVWSPALVSVASVCVLWALAAAVLRDARRGAAFASVAAFAWFQFGPLADLVNPPMAVGPQNVPPGLLLAVWGVVSLGLAALAARRWRGTERLTLFLNLASAAMCLLAVGSAVASQLAARPAAHRLDGSALTAPSVQPDVFYIVLDGFGRADVLQREYGVAAPSLESELERRGFYVAKDAHSNYVQTQLSLASSLNCDFVQNLASPMGDADRERLALDRLIDDSLVARSLKAIGYRQIAVTTGFPALEFTHADLRVQGDSGRSLFLSALVDKTPLRGNSRFTGSQFDLRRRDLSGGFDSLKAFAKRTSSPRFVVAHILAPHPPFVFGPNGEPRRPKGAFAISDGSHYVGVIGTADVYRQGYRDQAEYVTKRSLEAIDAILAQPGPRPIVIVQGDHGPKSGLDQERLDKTDVNECFPILSAYYVPEGVRSALNPRVTPVNSFRIVFSKVFGAKMAPLADDSYYSTWSRPLEFQDVTQKLTTRPSAKN